MRWFLGLMLVVALILGAAYGVGRFLLPNALDVTRTTQVERPRASVFAMINDLNIAREWSPYNARDPDADYAISPEPGAGQTMRWVSNLREVGSGRMSIVSSTENESVESIIEIGERATLNSRVQLRPAEGGTSVAWSVAAICAEGWVNVPCRYMNLIMRSTIEKDLDSGLARLKDRAEQLPPHNFEGYDITQTTMDSQDVIFVDVTLSSNSGATPAEINAARDEAERQGIEALQRLIEISGVLPDRNTLVRVFPPSPGPDGHYRFSVGYPYREGLALPVLAGARIGRTPQGAVLRGVFVGPRSQARYMYDRIRAYGQAHRVGLREDAEAWEVVTAAEQPIGATPDDPVVRTEIYYSIAADR